MALDTKARPIMMRNDADLPYINQVRVAHRAKNIIYRTGPARKVQIVIPSTPYPSPQSTVIRTLRRRSNTSSDLHAADGWIESQESVARSEGKQAENVEIANSENLNFGHVEHGEKEVLPESQVRVSLEGNNPIDKGVCVAESAGGNSDDALQGNDDGKDVALKEVRRSRALCAADFADSDDGNSLRGDGDSRGGLNLEVTTCWSHGDNKSELPQGFQLMMTQLRIQGNIMREIIQQRLCRHVGTAKIIRSISTRRH